MFSYFLLNAVFYVSSEFV